MEQLCGKEVCRRVKVVNHDARALENTVHLAGSKALESEAGFYITLELTEE